MISVGREATERPATEDTEITENKEKNFLSVAFSVASVNSVAIILSVNSLLT